MAKKKKSTPPLLSPEKYIKERVRNLPIGQCTIDKEWKNIGLTFIVVPRLHKQGTYTIGTYLVDTFCRGIVDSTYYFNISEEAYQEQLTLMGEHFDREEIDYVEAHNIIYGAIAFAETAGIQPHKSFELTRYILEEDTEDIPLIDYEFGKEEKHFLVAKDKIEASRYLPLLTKNLGDNFGYTLNNGKEEEEEEVYDEYEEYEEEDPYDEYDEEAAFLHAEMAAQIRKMVEKEKEGSITSSYSYVHPAYPTTLNLAHPKLKTLFYDPQHLSSLPEEAITEILSYPRESLIRDLELMALYETGCTCDGIPRARLNQVYYTPMLHILFFLGELKGENSLNVVLETLRQNDDYMEFHFGDAENQIYIPTLYLLGQDRLQTLWEFVQEPGLDPFAHYLIFPAVALIAREQPERRREIIEWFRKVLVFYTEKIAEATYCDGTLAAMLMSDLLDIQAQELLPEIKALFDTNLVDEEFSGDYKEVEEKLLSGEGRFYENYVFDIYERYKDYKQNWG